MRIFCFYEKDGNLCVASATAPDHNPILLFLYNIYRLRYIVFKCSHKYSSLALTLQYILVSCVMCQSRIAGNFDENNSLSRRRIS